MTCLHAIWETPPVAVGVGCATLARNAWWALEPSTRASLRASAIARCLRSTRDMFACASVCDGGDGNGAGSSKAQAAAEAEDEGSVCERLTRRLWCCDWDGKRRGGARNGNGRRGSDASADGNRSDSSGGGIGTGARRLAYQTGDVTRADDEHADRAVELGGGALPRVGFARSSQQQQQPQQPQQQQRTLARSSTQAAASLTASARSTATARRGSVKVAPV